MAGSASLPPPPWHTPVRTDVHLFGGTCHGFDSLVPDWAVSQALFDMQSAALRRFFAES